MTKLTTVLLPAAALVGYAATSLAGLKADEVVTVLPVTLTTPANATGSMAATRATSDRVARIGCWAIGNALGVTATCLATDVNNVSIWCSSAAPSIVKTIQAVNPSSHVAFTVDWDGSCNNVVIDDSSGWGLKR